jgi:hypothetical protein
MKMLSTKHLKDVCLAGSNSSEKCRYLAEDETEPSKYYCLKKSSRAKDVDVELEDFINEMRKRGKDPSKENVPMGNNCSGYPILRHKEQGYDKKS